jgi:hypothetical protein
VDVAPHRGDVADEGVAGVDEVLRRLHAGPRESDVVRHLVVGHLGTLDLELAQGLLRLVDDVVEVLEEPGHVAAVVRYVRLGADPRPGRPATSGEAAGRFGTLSPGSVDLP